MELPKMIRRLASVLLSPGDFGRSAIGSAWDPARIALKLLREAFIKTMSDPEVLAEAKKIWLGNKLLKRR